MGAMPRVEPASSLHRALQGPFETGKAAYMMYLPTSPGANLGCELPLIFLAIVCYISSPVYLTPTSKVQTTLEYSGPFLQSRSATNPRWVQ